MSRLFWKYLLAFWLAVAAVFIAVQGLSGLLRSLDHVPTLATETENLRTRVGAMTALVAAGDLAQGRRLLAQWHASHADPEIYVIDDAGHELLGRPLTVDDLEFARTPDRQDAPYSQSAATPEGRRYAIFIQEHVAGRLMYRTRVQLSWHDQLLAALLVGLVFSAVLAWYWAAPLRSLEWALLNIAQGHLDTRVTPRMGRRRNAFPGLGIAFDRMAQRIESLVQAQRRLLHDVSHELRSPLARLEVAIELAQRRHAPALAPELDRITHEAQRVNLLVDELLLLARLEHGIDTLPRGRVDVMELVVAIADDAQFEARARERDVTLACSGTFVADVNAEALYRAFENVIRNAVKYTRPGTTVAIDATATDTALIVTVADHGPGLPDDLLAAIFEPFRRFETAPDVGGFGLGLAIARHAMELHGGTIAAARNANGGLTFTLMLRRS